MRKGGSLVPVLRSDGPVALEVGCCLVAVQVGLRRRGEVASTGVVVLLRPRLSRPTDVGVRLVMGHRMV